MLWIRTLAIAPIRIMQQRSKKNVKHIRNMMVFAFNRSVITLMSNDVERKPCLSHVYLIK